MSRASNIVEQAAKLAEGIDVTEQHGRSFGLLMQEVAAVIDTDPNMLAPVMKAMCCAMLGPDAGVGIASEWVEPFLTWPLVIAESGWGKTPLINLATKIYRGAVDVIRFMLYLTGYEGSYDFDPLRTSVSLGPTCLTRDAPVHFGTSAHGQHS